MQYRLDEKSGNNLSVLGFGCMRFPRNAAMLIDMAKTEKLICKAVEMGINYFDTAYIYAGSEPALGEVVAKNNLRDKIFIATKLPIFKCKSYEDFDKFFNEQLVNLHTDYIDYYFMHNLSDVNIWKHLCELGIEKWIEEKKASGEIKQIGFSFHGMQDQFMALLDAFDWDFCQIQYNYMNINYQAGEAGLKKAAEKKLPVIIMEPLLGGRLATGLPTKAKEVFKAADAKRTPADWALNWLWNQKEVTVVLSGMNELAQLEENVALAEKSEAGIFSKETEEVFDKAITAFKESYKVPCTGCNYCMPCPHKVNIPACFASYNMSYAVGYFSGIQQYITSTGFNEPLKRYNAGRCKDCGLCEKHCPQHIEIRKELKNVTKRMEPKWLQTLITVVFKVLRK